MNTYIRVVTAISRLLGGLAAALIAASVLVVCQMVLFRYVLKESTIWQTEFVIYSLVAATFLGSPYVLLLRGHVNIGLVPQALPPKWRRLLAWMVMSVSLAFCLLVAWLGADLVREAYASGWRSESLWAPRLWIPYLSVPAGMGLLSLQYVAEMLRLGTRQAEPFDLSPPEAVAEEKRP